MYIPSGYNASSLFNLMTGGSLDGEISIVFSDGESSYTLDGDDAMSVSITSSLTDNQAYGMGNFSSKQATLVLLSRSLNRVVNTLGKYTNIPITISLQIASGVTIPMGVYYANPSDVISTEGISCTIRAYDKAYYLKGTYQPSITTWPVTPGALINDIITQHGDITLASDAYSGLDSALLSTSFCLDPTITAVYLTESLEDQTDTFTGNGSTTTFTLTHEPADITSCTVGGVATDDYSTDGTAITFEEAPASGATISVVYKYVQGGNVSYNTEPTSYRQAIAHVAFLMGANAVFDRNNKLKFVPFIPSSANRSSCISVTPDHYAALAFTKASNTKSYIGILDALYQYVDESGQQETGENIYSTGAYPNVLSINTVDITTAAVTNRFGAAILGNSGLDYQGYDISLLYGFPYLDCGDAITVTDYTGTVYSGLPIFSVTHTYNGAFTTSMCADALPDTDVRLSYSTNYKSKIDAMAMSAASANASAVAAQISADEALSDAATAHEAAQSAQQSATTAYNLASQVSGIAQQAQADAEQASQSAQAAMASASSASEQAGMANVYANSALDQLGIVENIVGVLDLVSKNGDYQLTEDTEVQPKKWYFTRSGTSPNYVYSVVSNPSGDPHAQGWYELVGVDEAIQNYVSSQLVVDDSGLWLKTAGMQTKVLLSATDGVVLYGTDGTVVGKYGATAQIGDAAGFHIEMDGTKLGFYQGSNEVAYISNNQLYITQSVVLQQMDLGKKVADGGLGQWSWKIHPNGQNPSRNNLNLKWIG